jgi:hypothetical protein
MVSQWLKDGQSYRTHASGIALHNALIVFSVLHSLRVTLYKQGQQLIHLTLITVSEIDASLVCLRELSFAYAS